MPCALGVSQAVQAHACIVGKERDAHWPVPFGLSVLKSYSQQQDDKCLALIATQVAHEIPIAGQ